MYKIYDGKGVFIGFADEARYVKTAKNGSMIECKASEAEGIAFRGEVHKGGGAVKAPDGVSLGEVRAIVGLDEDATAGLADMLASHEDAIAELAEMIANSNS